MATKIKVTSGGGHEGPKSCMALQPEVTGSLNSQLPLSLPSAALFLLTKIKLVVSLSCSTASLLCQSAGSMRCENPFDVG